MPVLNHDGRNLPLSYDDVKEFGADIIYRCDDCSRDQNRDVYHVDPDPRVSDAVLTDKLARLSQICGCEVRL